MKVPLTLMSRKFTKILSAAARLFGGQQRTESNFGRGPRLGPRWATLPKSRVLYSWGVGYHNPTPSSTRRLRCLDRQTYNFLGGVRFSVKIPYNVFGRNAREFSHQIIWLMTTHRM